MKKILFVASEANPYAGTGGLGDVIGSLPGALASENADLDVRVVIPIPMLPPRHLSTIGSLGRRMATVRTVWSVPTILCTRRT